MGVKQLSFFSEVNEKEVRRIVGRELKQYKALKVSLENKLERQEAGIAFLYPSLHSEESKKELKVKQMERALQNALDDIEREIIKQKYLSTTRVKDINLYIEMGLTKDQYYSYKRQAILQIATALGII
ncbi:ArpU family phage packaging/lysis transcriptional regulator [Heyndrickxia acidicola]|uniref:ArpU family phage packaging/lysis transcriptional regulator n=1 Tax=Heyndrickxia acidicola TaxID=209389 RepID=A0ABU6MC41_9BACI|nr:ArpU family phage packaging/lysis transcriptional regulator [Heyndrickxia acidicola]MED1201967.1 ArpU family phage packaging/lysis transcriptional regulator [Heyndrickxia acidicola]